jgi:magnesium chelatase family protein
MRVRSFVQDSQGLLPIEVELTLWPGLPCIQFLGLPDQQIKESAHRIKSAIRSQGYDFPKAKQILVNLRPNHLRKSSRGLELAVAVAYLLESGQVSSPGPSDKLIVYGQLDLSGNVYSPDDIRLLSVDELLLTGQLQQKNFSGSSIASLKNLGDLKNPLKFEKREENFNFSQHRPSLDKTFGLSEEMAELMAITALGRHSLLLAGVSGAGKSTFARALHSVLPDPDIEEWRNIQRQRPELVWRPLIRPHHTTPVMTMIGGGTKIFNGEIARAHGGVLLLDELLEFHPYVLEALREPMEEKTIRVVRNGTVKDFMADCQIVATTNLCPCGRWTPENKTLQNCSYSQRRCRSTLERLSGPFLDRFCMLVFFSNKKTGKISLDEVYRKVISGLRFRKNRKTTSEEESDLKSLLPDSSKSHRRTLATLSVARTIADLALQEKVQAEHLQKAMQYTYTNFEKILR